MKKLTLFCALVCFILSCKSKKQPDTIVILKSNEVEIIKSNRAYSLGKRLLEACSSSRFKPFTIKEATEKVIKNATPERISETCKKINFRNGKFIALELIDISLNKTTDQFIFRYNIVFEKKVNQRQLTVIVDADNRVSSISTKEIDTKPF